MELTRLSRLRHLVERVSSAPVDRLLDETLSALESIAAVDRAAILLFDAGGTMRFLAWRGLSDEYRHAVEGHSPWPSDARRPSPVLIPDVTANSDLAEYASLFEREAIRALAFFPLSASDELLGKFVLYYRQTHEFSEEEVELARIVAGHLAYVLTHVFRSVSERERAERRAEWTATRLQRLQNVSAFLGEALSYEQVARAVVTPGLLEAVGAGAAAVYAKEEDGSLRLLASSGYSDQLLKKYARLEADARLPAIDALRNGQAVYATTVRDLYSRYPNFSALDTPGRSFAAIPIADKAVLGFRFFEERTFGDEDREFFRALAAQCAQAFERASLYEREREAREAAEQAQKRLSFLVEASALLGTSLDDEATLNQVARAAIPTMADWCAVELARGEGDNHGASDPVAVAHRDPSKTELAHAFRNRSGRPPQAVSEVIRTGKPRLFAELAERRPRDGPRDAAYEDVVRELELCSAMVVPIAADGKILGAIIFAMAESGRRYTEPDLRLALRLAERAGVAIENARLYAAERTARAQALAAEQRKDNFLAMLGHELRNPLAPIVTALDVMRLSDREGAVFPRERELIERQVRYLQRLVDDLLDVSRITRGKLQLKRETVALPRVVQDAVEMTSPLLEERGHRLQVRFPQTDIWVRGDRVRLSQMVSNLLSNAAKYTPPGGRIEIEGERAGEQALLRVVDNGVGLEPELLPRIFDLFEQGESSAGELRRGLGLGLTIVRRIAQLHGGDIEVHSDGAQQGSRFEVRLPLAPAKSASQDTMVAVREAAACHQPENCRVLIVDDNRDAAEVLDLVLKKNGYKTAVALDGPTALQLAERFEPDVALLDIGLPVMNGYELARRLRQRDGHHRPRLVAITGYGQEHDRKRALEAGFDAHYVKPVSLDAILEAVSANPPGS